MNFELSDGLELNPPASRVAVEEAEAALGVKLPVDYREFLLMSNGAEGAVGSDGYLQLWRAEELQALNEAHAVAEYAPGLILFGSNGAGTGYAFDQHQSMSIVNVPFIGLSLQESRQIASTFVQFLAAVSV